MTLGNRNNPGQEKTWPAFQEPQWSMSRYCVGVTFILFRVASSVAVRNLQTITTRVPDEIYEDIKKIGSEEKTERAEVIRRLLAEAIKRWKLKRALDTLREGRLTLRSAARLAGLTYMEMVDEAEKAGISIGYTMADLQFDVEAVKKKEK